MENSGKSLAIPCTSRGTLEKLYPLGIQGFVMLQLPLSHPDLSMELQVLH